MTEAAEFFVFLQSVDGGERPAGFWARVVRAFLANGVSGPFVSCILCNAWIACACSQVYTEMELVGFEMAMVDQATIPNAGVLAFMTRACLAAAANYTMRQRPAVAEFDMIAG